MYMYSFGIFGGSGSLNKKLKSNYFEIQFFKVDWVICEAVWENVDLTQIEYILRFIFVSKSFMIRMHLVLKKCHGFLYNNKLE